METVVPMASDQSAIVRTGLLEALGEIIYSFHPDGPGAPQELVDLFVGRAEDLELHSGEKLRLDNAARLRMSLHTIFGGSPPASAPPDRTPIESFFLDPGRPFICAFNLPAVALTLGRNRWKDLRDMYAQLLRNPDCSVHQTLTASLGELAKIIGPHFAEEDLFPAWKDGIQSSEEDTAGKAIESTPLLAENLSPPFKKEVVQVLLDALKVGTLASWRNREKLAYALGELASIVGNDGAALLVDLSLRSLKDVVYAVRLAAVNSVRVLLVPSCCIIPDKHLVASSHLAPRT